MPKSGLSQFEAAEQSKLMKCNKITCAR